MKFTVLSPHRDDAAFSVGLAIQAWIDAGHTVEVVNCFTESEYSPFGSETLVSGAERVSRVSAQRHQEDVRWSRCYARPVALIDLTLIDAPQRLGCGVDAVCTFPVDADDSAIATIHAALADKVTDALVLPLALGNHVDHLTARIAAERGWPLTLPLAFYEDLPYAARPGAAEAIEPRVEDLNLGLESAFVCRPANVAEARRRKRHLANCYASQIDAEVAEQIAGFCERYHGRERLWVNRAWLDAGLGITA